MALSGGMDFAELADRYRDLAYATAVSLLGDYHRAEDAVQEALLAAHASLPTLRDEAAFPGWLRGIVRHCCFRILRGRDLGALPGETAAPSESPVDHADRQERRLRALAAVHALPRPLRETAALFYLKDCTQREVAAFLGVPVTTVNNRLHKARTLMKRRMMTMSNQTFPQDISDRIGRILTVDGPVVDARFEPDVQPELFDSLASAEGERMRVAQIVGDGVVRCLVTGDAAALAPGQSVANTTAQGGTWAASAISDEDLARAVDVFGDAPADLAMVETGIKPVDLFCALPARGNVALFGTAGTGKIVITHELMHRLGGKGPRLFYLGARTEPALVRDMRDEDEGLHLDEQCVWLTNERATDPVFAARTDLFDATIYCSPLLGAQGLWPATDPFHSQSRVRIDDRHADLARRARETMAKARRLMLDPVFLEYLACRAFAATRERLAEFTVQRLGELAPEDATLVGRARRLERFLTTPFFTVEDYNKIPGQSVPLADTLDGVERILAGELDETPEDELRWIGKLPS